MSVQLAHFATTQAEELLRLDGELQALAAQAFAHVRGVPAPCCTPYSCVPVAIRNAVRDALGAGLFPDLPNSAEAVDLGQATAARQFSATVLSHSSASDTDDIPLIRRCKRARRQEPKPAPAVQPAATVPYDERSLSKMPIDDLFRLISGLDPELPTSRGSRSGLLGVPNPAIRNPPASYMARPAQERRPARQHRGQALGSVDPSARSRCATASMNAAAVARPGMEPALQAGLADGIEQTSPHSGEANGPPAGDAGRSQELQPREREGNMQHWDLLRKPPQPPYGQDLGQAEQPQNSWLRGQSPFSVGVKQTHQTQQPQQQHDDVGQEECRPIRQHVPRKRALLWLNQMRPGAKSRRGAEGGPLPTEAERRTAATAGSSRHSLKLPQEAKAEAEAPPCRQQPQPAPPVADLDAPRAALRSSSSCDIPGQTGEWRALEDQQDLPHQPPPAAHAAVVPSQPPPSPAPPPQHQHQQQEPLSQGRAYRVDGVTAAGTAAPQEPVSVTPPDWERFVSATAAVPSLGGMEQRLGNAGSVPRSNQVLTEGAAPAVTRNGGEEVDAPKSAAEAASASVVSGSRDAWGPQPKSASAVGAPGDPERQQQQKQEQAQPQQRQQLFAPARRVSKSDSTAACDGRKPSVRATRSASAAAAAAALSSGSPARSPDGGQKRTRRRVNPVEQTQVSDAVPVPAAAAAAAASSPTAATAAVEAAAAEPDAAAATPAATAGGRKKAATTGAGSPQAKGSAGPSAPAPQTPAALKLQPELPVAMESENLSPPPQPPQLQQPVGSRQRRALFSGIAGRGEEEAEGRRQAKDTGRALRASPRGKGRPAANASRTSSLRSAPPPSVGEAAVAAQRTSSTAEISSHPSAGRLVRSSGASPQPVELMQVAESALATTTAAVAAADDRGGGDAGVAVVAGLAPNAKSGAKLIPGSTAAAAGASGSAAAAVGAEMKPSSAEAEAEAKPSREAHTAASGGGRGRSAKRSCTLSGGYCASPNKRVSREEELMDVPLAKRGHGGGYAVTRSSARVTRAMEGRLEPAAVGEAFLRREVIGKAATETTEAAAAAAATAKVGATMEPTVASTAVGFKSATNAAPPTVDRAAGMPAVSQMPDDQVTGCESATFMPATVTATEDNGRHPPLPASITDTNREPSVGVTAAARPAAVEADAAVQAAAPASAVASAIADPAAADADAAAAATATAATRADPAMVGPYSTPKPHVGCCAAGGGVVPTSVVSQPVLARASSVADTTTVNNPHAAEGFPAVESAQLGSSCASGSDRATADAAPPSATIAAAAAAQDQSQRGPSAGPSVCPNNRGPGTLSRSCVPQPTTAAAAEGTKSPGRKAPTASTHGSLRASAVTAAAPNAKPDTKPERRYKPVWPARRPVQGRTVPSDLPSTHAELAAVAAAWTAAQHGSNGSGEGHGADGTANGAAGCAAGGATAPSTTTAAHAAAAEAEVAASAAPPDAGQDGAGGAGLPHPAEQRDAAVTGTQLRQPLSRDTVITVSPAAHAGGEAMAAAVAVAVAVAGAHPPFRGDSPCRARAQRPERKPAGASDPAAATAATAAATATAAASEPYELAGNSDFGEYDAPVRPPTSDTATSPVRRTSPEEEAEVMPPPAAGPSVTPAAAVAVAPAAASTGSELGRQGGETGAADTYGLSVDGNGDELSRRNSSDCGSGATEVAAKGDGKRSGNEGPGGGSGGGNAGDGHTELSAAAAATTATTADAAAAADADAASGGAGGCDGAEGDEQNQHREDEEEDEDEEDADRRISEVEREEWRRRRAEIERQRAEAAAEREAARRARIAAQATSRVAAEELERRIRQRLAEHHQLASAAAAEAAAKEGIRIRVRDSLQERFRKALDEHNLPKFLRQLEVLPKGACLRTSEQRNKALKVAKIRFHPDKVTGSLEDRVYAEEVSKLLNSWAWSK